MELTIDKEYNVVYKSKGLNKKSEVYHAFHIPLFKSGPSPPAREKLMPGILFLIGNRLPNIMTRNLQGGKKWKEFMGPYPY